VFDEARIVMLIDYREARHRAGARLFLF